MKYGEWSMIVKVITVNIILINVLRSIISSAYS